MFVPFQIRRHFECYDDVIAVDGRDVRHCNWVRFVQTESRDKANIVAMRIHGDVVFMVTTNMATHSELRMLFTYLEYDFLPVYHEVLDDLKGMRLTTCH